MIFILVMAAVLTTPKGGNAPQSVPMIDLNPNHTIIRRVIVLPEPPFQRTLIWDAVTNAASYTLYYGTNADLTGPWSTNVTGTGATVTLTTNQFFTDYFYASVTAVTFNGIESPRSIAVREPDFDYNGVRLDWSPPFKLSLLGTSDLPGWSVMATDVTPPVTNNINFDIDKFGYMTMSDAPVSNVTLRIDPLRLWNSKANHFGR